MKVITIAEDCHGFIGIADTFFFDEEHVYTGEE